MELSYNAAKECLQLQTDILHANSIGIRWKFRLCNKITYLISIKLLNMLLKHKGHLSKNLKSSPPGKTKRSCGEIRITDKQWFNHIIAASGCLKHFAKIAALFLYKREDRQLLLKVLS